MLFLGSVFKEPITVNYLHRILLTDYFKLLEQTIDDCTGRNAAKFKDYIDIANVIIDHHNQYRKETKIGNYHDFMSIIPTNMSIMTTGFLAGIETKRNAKKVRAYRLFLMQYCYDLVDQLEKIEWSNE